MKKVALITGSSRGIGRAAALELAKRGYAVAINYLTHQAEAEDLLDGLLRMGAQAAAFRADVADRAQVRQMVGAAEKALGPVSLLVNNAGIAPAGRVFQHMCDEEWNRALAVNLGGMRHAILEVLPRMLEEKRGTIVNVSSVWGLRGASCEVTYACTKAAVVALTRSLALELAPSNIRVNAVAPGCVDTDMVRALGRDTMEDLARQTPLGRLGTPEEIARAIAFLGTEESAFITGQILTADGGWTV